MVEKADLIPKDLIIKPNEKKAIKSPAVQKLPTKKAFYNTPPKMDKIPGPGLVFFIVTLLLVIITVFVFVFVQVQYKKAQRSLFEASQL